MKPHITNTVVMVPPESFGYNPETAGTNPFQHTATSLGLTDTGIREKALKEYGSVKKKLTENGISVLELSPPAEPCPDAVFPNNWFSHHENGSLIVYPMLTPSRRKERQIEKLKHLLQSSGIPVEKVFDLTGWENKNWILEGTGSVSLDRSGKFAFAMESARTSKSAFLSWCRSFSYTPVFFHGYDTHHVPIYHTNILLNIGERFAVICADAIPDTTERNNVVNTLQKNGKDIIFISIPQMLSFCGNILHLKTRTGEDCVVLSSAAHNAFLPQQLRSLEKHGKLITVDIPTIETIGGGSSRCMLAEVFHSYGNAGKGRKN